MFWNIFFTVVGFLFTTIFRPTPPESEGAKAEQFDGPLANEGAPVPVIFGKIRLRSPNTIRFANSTANPVYKTQKIGGPFSSKTKRQIIAHDYSASLTYGLGRSPLSLHKIWYGKDVVWKGELKAGIGNDLAGSLPPLERTLKATERLLRRNRTAYNRSTRDSSMPYLGDRSRNYSGGWANTGGNSYGTINLSVEIEKNQDKISSLKAEIADLKLAVRTNLKPLTIKPTGRDVKPSKGEFFDGIGEHIFENKGIVPSGKVAFVHFEKFNAGRGPYIQNISFEVSRFPSPFPSATAYSVIREHDANPVYCIYEILTDDDLGVVVSPNQIDTASFIKAAKIVHSEGIGVSFDISRTTTASTEIKELMRLIDGVYNTNPSTGKLQLVLIRESTLDELANATALTPSDLQEITYTAGSWESTKSKVRVSYNSRDREYSTKICTSKDLSNIHHTPGRVLSEFNASKVTNVHTANLLAARLLTTLSVPVFAIEFSLVSIIPLTVGSLIKITYPNFKIDGEYLRVREVSIGPRENPVIQVKAVQDTFSRHIAVSGSQPNLAPSSSIPPLSQPDHVLIQEAPFFVFRASGRRLAYLMGYTGPTTAESFSIDEITPNGQLVNLEEESPLIPVSSLTTILPSDEFTATLTLPRPRGFTPLKQRVPWETLKTGTTNLIIIGNEICFYENAIIQGDNIVLSSIHRGMLDTVPFTHPVNEGVFFVEENSLQTSDSEFQLGHPPQIHLKVTINTSSSSSLSFTFLHPYTTPNPIPRAQLPLPFGLPILESSTTENETITHQILLSPRERTNRFAQKTTDQTGAFTPQSMTAFIKITKNNANLPKTSFSFEVTTKEGTTNLLLSISYPTSQATNFKKASVSIFSQLSTSKEFVSLYPRVLILP